MTKSRWVAALLVLAVGGIALPAQAQNRECESDADCGFGFECYHSAGTTVTTGVGGSSGPVCGDNFCEYPEDVDTCPDDCDRYTSCIPAACDPNVAEQQCADGYVCTEDSFSGATVTGGGPFCGDFVCNGDETEESCPDDCATTYSCQVEYRTCSSDEDCADGFYCDLGGATDTGSASGSTGVGGATTTTVTGTTGISQDATDNVVSTATFSSVTTGTSIGGAGSQSPPAADGVCHLVGSSSTGTTTGGGGGSGVTTNGVTTSGATGLSSSSSANNTSGSVDSASSSSNTTGQGGTGTGSVFGNVSGSDSANGDSSGSGGSGTGGNGSSGAAGADGSDGSGGSGATGSSATSSGGVSDTLGSTASTSPGAADGSDVSGNATSTGGSGGTEAPLDGTDTAGGCACGIVGRPSAPLVNLLFGFLGVGWLRRRQR